MPMRIDRYQATPNPLAIKCFLTGAISSGPKSFRSAREAGDDAAASAIFGVGGVASLYFNGDWMTVNKTPEAEWGAVKKGVERVLAELA